MKKDEFSLFAIKKQKSGEFSASCRCGNCSWVSLPKSSEERAKAAWQFHHTRVHQKIGQQTGEPSIKKKEKLTEESIIPLRFCPCCGVNLSKIEAAMRVVGRIS